MKIEAPTNSCKFRHVYDVLMTQLTSGKFPLGSKLPSEREFASDLQVTTGTVRRAFRDLIVSGIVEKRIGSGTYLKTRLDSDWQDRVVNVVFDTTYGGTVKGQLESLFTKEALARDRKIRVVNLGNEELPQFLENCVTYGQPSILCSSNYNQMDAMQKAPQFFVALSSMIYESGIPVIKCDDNQVIMMLVEHLRKLGHHRIALLREDNAAGNGLAEMQTAVWRNALGRDYDPALRLLLQEDDDKDLIARASAAVRAALQNTRFTALICGQDELLYGAMSAIRTAGLDIPRDISLVSIGNTSLSEYAWPPVTTIDPNLPSHVAQAFELLDFNYNHPGQLEKLRLVSPKLVIRASTARAVS